MIVGVKAGSEHPVNSLGLDVWVGFFIGRDTLRDVKNWRLFLDDHWEFLRDALENELQQQSTTKKEGK